MSNEKKRTLRADAWCVTVTASRDIRNAHVSQICVSSVVGASRVVVGAVSLPVSRVMCMYACRLFLMHARLMLILGEGLLNFGFMLHENENKKFRILDGGIRIPISDTEYNLKLKICCKLLLISIILSFIHFKFYMLGKANTIWWIEELENVSKLMVVRLDSDRLK